MIENLPIGEALGHLRWSWFLWVGPDSYALVLAHLGWSWVIWDAPGFFLG